MSREDLELATRAIRAAVRQPKPDFDTMNELFDAEHVWVPVMVRELGEDEARGGRGYQQWLREGDEIMPWKADFEGAVDVGGGKVLVVVTNHMHGAASGIELEQRFWTLVTVRSGKIVRSEAFTDPAEALRAATKDS